MRCGIIGGSSHPDLKMKPAFKPSPVEIHQRLMFPSNVIDLRPKDHDCFVYRDIFQHLDTSELENR